MEEPRRLTPTIIFWTFLRIGPSTFGGGYAMMPVIEREIVQKKGWINDKELADMISLAGSAPEGLGLTPLPSSVFGRVR